ncbi:LLM class flavin-dependent oxidoreductase [Gordonia sp. NB41Y]|uniref:LLM class flavin-dependent oxidoreductase n=1 Tax=Gordonia sp. NB41Y TaxID=875808 RepID=UPI0002BFB89F|nr:LLM class flavin-dependent oxidoreductase [Gordonia sp. NB41Y]EMP10885.1 luciferase [Gordonia sp. NB41Y]WLP88776.1 LLM class flavin-dependent oxidoreductase [Gordonia sp. NB41Y]
MRIGICILPDLTWRQSRPLYERAEAMGFDHVWTYDHLVWGGLPDSRWFSCVPTLTAAATATSTIGLGTFVASPNFRHPVSFAREIQTLIDISDGRLLLGLGAGGTPDDTVLGSDRLPPKQRVDRLQEFTELLDRTLRDDHVDFGGTYYSARDMRLVGGPVRDRVPLLLAGNGPRSVRYAARTGDGWVTTGTTADGLDDWFDGIARNCALLDETLSAAGRTNGFARLISLDASPRTAFESIDLYDEMIGRAAELGFTDVIVHWPRDTEPYRASERVLEAVVARGLHGVRH